MLFLFLASLVNPLPLEQFQPTTNNNIPVQNQARFNSEQPLRTNDFQALQQRAATNRQIVRMGAFYISQGPEGVGLSLPATANNTSTEITTDNIEFLLGSTQTSSFSISTDLLSTQTLLVTYTNPLNTTQTLTDYNVIGNAFHDVQYTNLTPLLTFNTTVQFIRIDDKREQRIYPNIFIQRGQKFRLTMSTGRVFLLYFDRPIQLTLNTAGNTLTAQFPYTGFLRVAAIETNTPTTFGITTQPVNWATTIEQQTLPTTPLAMFMLWPVEWTRLVGPQIRTFINQRIDTRPDCPIVSQMLPVLARTDFSGANSAFNQLLSIQPTGQQVFNDDTNAFLTYFFMVAARDLDSAISSYQSASTTLPTFSADTIESTFDAHKSVIPTSCDVAFAENEHSFSYFTIGGSNPLVIFPSWKPQTAISGFGYNDPIKGPLPGATATDNTITFTSAAVPTWFSGTSFSFDLINFFPSFLNLSKTDRNTLSRLTIGLRPTITESNVRSTGQQVYQLALTAKVMTLVFRQNGQSLGRISLTTRPLINRVKAELTAWLQTRNVTDYFVGDTTTGGVCTIAGMSSSTSNVTTIDDGNAIYNDHHLQYGYWLMAAAFVVEWDILNNTRVPWINIPIGGGFRNRDLVDMLWRDARNADKEDPQLPFNRHGNPWEGHSTQNGALYTPSSTGREQGSFAEDFHSWLATNLYARAIRLSNVNESFFSELETFAQTNLQMTAESGKLVYQDNNWFYAVPYAANLTVGNVTDSTTTSENPTPSGTPCPITIR